MSYVKFEDLKDRWRDPKPANDEPKLWAKPFVWRDPTTIPPRDHLYGRHYTRQFTSATFAPGGGNKSSLVLAEAVAMASGRGLLGELPKQRLRVWYWNGEDPLEETERRLAALMLHYQLQRADLEEWLFIGSGREAELVIAKQTRDGADIYQPDVDAVQAMLAELRVDVATIDPFVSCHRVMENDNPAIDRVAKTWGKIADVGRCAVELVHHTRKTGGNEITVEDGRGAGSLLFAVRSARVINPMTEEEAGLAGVEKRGFNFRVDNGKSNFAPPAERSDWFRMESVELGNGDGLSPGDSIGVVTKWTFPNAMDGVKTDDLAEVQRRVAAGSFREHYAAKDWVGNVVADVLKLDVVSRGGKAKAKSVLKKWLAMGALVVVMRADERRQTRPFVEVGTPADELAAP